MTVATTGLYRDRERDQVRVRECSERPREYAPAPSAVPSIMARPYTTACRLTTARPFGNRHEALPRLTRPAALAAHRNGPCPLPSGSRCMQARTPENLFLNCADRSRIPDTLVDPDLNEGAGCNGARTWTRRSSHSSRSGTAGFCNTVKSRWVTGTCCRWTGSTGPVPIGRAKAPGAKPPSSAGTPISPTRSKRSPAACAVA